MSDRARRVTTVAVVAAVLAVGVALPLSLLAPLGDRDKGVRPAGDIEPSPGAVGGIPDVARMRCEGGELTMHTPIVAVQEDGLHAIVEGDGGFATLVDGSTENVSLGVPRTDEGDSLSLPPGEYRLACSTNVGAEAIERLRESWSAGEGPRISLVDPNGYYGIPAPMDCATDWVDRYIEVKINSTEAKINPPEVGADVVRRMLVGLAAEDRVTPVGYHRYDPVARGWQMFEWQVLRGGAAVARIRTLVDPDKKYLVLLDGKACQGAEIEAADAVGNPEAPLATTYEVPGYAPCSPYDDATCTPVWMSWSKLASLSDQSEVQLDYPAHKDPDLEWCQPGGAAGDRCARNPDLDPKVVFMVQADAERWFAENGCGRTHEQMCHLPMGP